MKGILIDPHAKTIEARDFPGSGLAAIRAAIGPVCVDRVPLAPGVDLWVDDEGFLNAQEAQAYFGLLRVDGSVQALAGRAVIFGIDPAGEMIDCPEAVRVPFVRDALLWLGDAWELDAAMTRGEVERPQNGWTDLSTGKQEITWVWNAPRRPAGSPEVAR